LFYRRTQGLLKSLLNGMTTPDGAEHQAVKKQLERMLSHPAFSGAPRLSSLLTFIANETLDGRGDQLKEYTLGVAVFSRGTRFDPRLDSIVRVEASKLRARLAAYYKDAGANDPILIELPRGTYIPRMMPRPLITHAAPRRNAIAVLPFINLGPEPDSEYLANGLAEEIIDRLGTMPGMQVVARTSAFQFKDKSEDIQQIGRTLGVGYLIEGSVRNSGNHFRVNARLIDAKTGYRLWSHAYESIAADIYNLPAEITNGIGVALGGQGRSSLPGTAGHGLTGDAYHLYLRGRFHRNQWTLEGCEKSIESLQRALALEPDSAQILAALSEVLVLRTVVGTLPAAQPMETARAAAERAIAIDHHCAQAHLTLGWIHHVYSWQWDSGLLEFDRALQVNPSLAEAWHLRGLFLALRQRNREADEAFKQALVFDPLSLVIHAHTALVSYFSGDLDDAQSRAQAALSLESRFPETHWVLGWIYEGQGKYKKALAELQAAIQFGGENPSLLGDVAFLYARLEEFERAREILQRLESGFGRPHPAASILARIYLGLGEPAKSNACLQEAFEARDVMLPWACADSRYREMWLLPAFSGFRRRILGQQAVNG
jgi:adenylate cyclase